MEQNRESSTVPSMYENTIHTKKALHISEERYTSQWASLVAQTVKNLPAIWETRVRSLGQEDHGGGHGNPLQYSCLENPMDRGTYQATVRGVAESDMTKVTEHAHTYSSQ